MAVSFSAAQAAAAAQKAAAAKKATPAKATTTYGAPAVIAKPTAPASKSSGGYSGIPLISAQNKPVVTSKAKPKPVEKPKPKEVIPVKQEVDGEVPPPVVAGKTVLRTVTNADGTVTIFYSDGTNEVVGTPTKKEDDKKTSNIAYDTIGKILESYRITGLASVLESIREEYPEISSDDIVTLLQFDDRYNAKFNERFAANVDRLKAGKPVLSPGDYLKLEQGYIKVLDAYNLPTFNTQKYYDTFIKSDLDVVEVTDRVQLAYDRVLSDAPVNTAFKQFFPALGLGDIVAGMLDPVNQLPALQRKVKAAEIGGAALRQGFKDISETATSMTVGADVLAQQGLTKAEAEAGYQEIAQQLPQAEKFSSIYAGQTESYGRLEAEKEQLQGLASEERKKKRLIALEAAQFGGDSGTSKASVNTNYLSRQSGAGQY